MKNRKNILTCTACLLLGVTLCLPASLPVHAAEIFATVQGTISSKTTSDILFLSTSDGTMEIKLDQNTDTSECKIMLPGKKVSVAVTYGSDSYLHAARISTQIKAPSANVDTSNTTTVVGTLTSDTREDLLFLKTPQGEMQIKFDADTSLENCSVLIVGETYAVTCARGSDAYMHAVSISDSTEAGAVTSTPGNNTAFMSVSGTVDNDTKENLLYLDTKDGEMQFVIDYNADTSKGMMLTPGRPLTVFFYHGTDGYLHAVLTAGSRDSSSTAQVDTSSTVSVTGTVDSRSTENMLYLNTPQGTMELKLDKLGSLNNCKVLVSGKKVSVSCAYGSDAYMHAVSITGL